jgi:2-oxoglutarate dehydrogenase E2 component (dihydrolipoamide succinyltransferase)
MTYGHIQSTAVEIPSPRLLPVVVGTIAALAVVGFVLGLEAADDGGRAAASGSDLANAAALAGAPLASPIILNPADEAPPAVVEPEKTEEVETPEAAAAPEILPPTPDVAAAPAEAAPAAPAAPPPAAAADALY